MPSTAPLERYIKRAIQQPSAEIFERSSHVRTPTLVKGEVNRILTYRGCFNPPHEGHKAALCHGFFRGGDGLNIVAAVVFLLDDYDVECKYRHNKDGIKNYILTKDERINLWNSGGLYGGWHWCFPGSIRGQYEFLRRLCEEAARDGFEVQFVVLTGPDHVGHRHDEHVFYGNTIIVGTGDAERTNFRAENALGFRNLVGYGNWQMQSLSEDFLRRLGTGGNLEWLEQKLSMLFPDKVKDLPTDPSQRRQVVTGRLRAELWRLGPNRLCPHKSGSLEQSMCYVPTRFIGMSGGTDFLGHKESQLSSTRIRHVLAEIDNKEVVIQALSGVTLSPALLFEYIQQHKAEEARIANKQKYLEGKLHEAGIQQHRADEMKVVEEQKHLGGGLDDATGRTLSGFGTPTICAFVAIVGWVTFGEFVAR